MKAVLFILFLVTISLNAQTKYGTDTRSLYQFDHVNNTWSHITSNPDNTTFIVKDSSYYHYDNENPEMNMVYTVIKEEMITTISGVKEKVKNVKDEIGLSYDVIQGHTALYFIYKQGEEEFAIVYNIKEDKD